MHHNHVWIKIPKILYKGQNTLFIINLFWFNIIIVYLFTKMWGIDIWYIIFGTRISPQIFVIYTLWENCYYCITFTYRATIKLFIHSTSQILMSGLLAWPRIRCEYKKSHINFETQLLFWLHHRMHCINMYSI